ncbi:Hypothetical protein PBC10988_17290 [Planctomycetales bacterium 10988]|nr:Hypothetical protein PBC10988_17290 [Planctomycetales bacterium 10988]
MSADFYSMLNRYVGRRICLTLHGQTNIWGKVAAVYYDGLRLSQAIVSTDFDSYTGFDQPISARGEPSSRETMVHVNQILAVTCLEEDLPEVEESPSQTASNAEKPLVVETLVLEVGSALYESLSKEKEESFEDQTSALRQRIASDLGLFLPDWRLQKSKQLEEDEFVVKVRGVRVGKGTVFPKRFLALARRPFLKPLATESVAPSLLPYGVTGWWIRRPEREMAEAHGYEVLDMVGFLVLHLEEIVRLNAARLFGRQQLQELLDQTRTIAPSLVEEVIPEMLSPRKLQKVLRLLLREQVPVRDMETILETISDWQHEVREPRELADKLRLALASVLVERCQNEQNTLEVILLDPALESALSRLLRNVNRSVGMTLGLTPKQRSVLLSALEEELEEAQIQGRSQVVLTSARLRSPLWQLLSSRLPHCHVLSHEEVEQSGEHMESTGMVFHTEGFPADEPIEKEPTFRESTPARKK